MMKRLKFLYFPALCIATTFLLAQCAIGKAKAETVESGQAVKVTITVTVDNSAVDWRDLECDEDCFDPNEPDARYHVSVDDYGVVVVSF